MTVAGEREPKSGTAADLEAPTRSVSITEWLRCSILAGQFQSGERLYEVTLSETLQVSRTPIRAALQSLAGEGLLDHIPNRGYYVRGFSVEEIVQAYEIRAALEGLAAKRAALLGLGPEEHVAIKKALKDGDELLQKGDLSPTDRSTYGEINAAFHSAIHNAGQSRMLRDMLRMSQQVAPSSHRNVIAFEHHDVRRRHDDHHRIYETILERDAGRAELLMRDHVERVKGSLIRSLSASTTAAEAMSAAQALRDSE
ncbi:GntR family transcriptional regulator [Microvirga massiliensis]|uniref:GntR family transcriptional regulator n=1 Tax=Microvirga massiliensis TaxID=1033741 RepID=UPI00062BAF39|nr:GntR family transcriptional regulator [Microvirga massiliensis]